MSRLNFTLLTAAVISVLNSSAVARDSHEIANDPTKLFFNNLGGAIAVLWMVGYVVYLLAKGYDQSRQGTTAHLEIPVVSNQSSDTTASKVVSESDTRPQSWSPPICVCGPTACLTTVVCLPMGLMGTIFAFAFFSTGEFLASIVAFGLGFMSLGVLIPVVWSYFRHR